MQQAATKTSSITDQINQLGNGREITEMDLRRIKREIEQVKHAGIAEYYMLLGMLYSVVGNEAECRANHERSISLSSEVIFFENYAFSLKRFCAGADSLSLFLRAFNINPASETFVDLLQAMVYAGDLREFHKVVEQYKKSHPEEDVESYDFVRYIRRVQGYLDVAQVSAFDFRTSMQTLGNVLLRTGTAARLEAINIESGSFDGVSHINVVILLGGQSSNKLAEINDLIAEAMVASDDIVAWDRVIFTVGRWVESMENVA